MKYLLSRLDPLKAPVTVLVIFTILLTLYISYAFFPDGNNKHTIQWGNASWIGSSYKTSAAHFRKNLLLSEKPLQAIIKLSATDKYRLYVNGRLLDERIFISSRPSGIYDVTNYLTRGDNVIAVRVESHILQSSPELLASIAIKNSAAKHTVVTDESWRVMNIEERQKYGHLSWTEALFSDTHWQQAILSDSSLTMANKSVIDPLTAENMLYGKWIWQDDLTAKNTVMKKTVNIDKSLGRIKSAWLGIFTRSSYKLFCNGPLIADDRDGTQAMMVYNITPCIHNGENNITISLADVRSKGSLLIGGAIMVDGRVINISSDSSWLYRSSAANETEEWQRAYIIDSLYPTWQSEKNPKGRPILRFIDDGYADSRGYKRIVSGGIIWIGFLFATLFGFVVFRKAIGASLDKDILREMKAYSTPFMVVSIILTTILLSQLDVRLHYQLLYSWPVLIVLLSLIVLWLMYIIFELHNEHAVDHMSESS